MVWPLTSNWTASFSMKPQLPSTLWLSATAASNTRLYDKTLGVDPKRISRQMRGDLDWIVRKALEKDRSLRYSSADKLADDLAAYLRDEPVSAGPPSLGYRLRKAYCRHRIVTLAASLVLFVMFCGGGIALDQWQRAEAARAQESQAREGEASARAASDEPIPKRWPLLTSCCMTLAPKLEDVNRASLLQSVADKTATCHPAQNHDVADSSEGGR